jgi:predicted O-methyltransferase YrrM
MDWNELTRIIMKWTENEKPEPDPPWMAYQQSDRMREVADLCARTHPGDLVEIGCHTGGTTRELGRVAREHGRRVIAVDPWEKDPSVYDDFLRRTEEYSDLIDVIRLPSQDERAIERIKARQLCFAFVDGSHEREPLACDIRTVAHCAGAIAVDDVSWHHHDLRKILWEGARGLGYALYWHPLCREGYLIPC